MDEDEISYSSDEDEVHEVEQQEASPHEKVGRVGENERRWVICSKTFVVIVLLASAGVVGYLTHWFMSSEETENFETQYKFDAEDVLGISKTHAARLVNTMMSTSILVTSFSNFGGDSFPNLTIPDWEAFASQALFVTGGLSMAYSPTVTEDNRVGFETYAVENRGWIAESFEFRGEDYEPVTISEYIYRKTSRNNIPEAPPGPYSPLWMLSPPPKDYSVILFNLFNQPTYKRLARFCSFTKETAISEVINTETLLGSSAPQGEDPQSIMMTPIFKHLENQTIVGYLTMVIPWVIFFDDILSDKDSVLDCVLRSSCGESFTYRVQGGMDPVYRGEGDLHQTNYNRLRRSSDFLGYQGNLVGVTGLEDHCQYTIDLYPTSQMEDSYTTNRPIIFTVIVLGIFFFASTVFALYDIFVMRRQRVVQDTALRAMSIVTSLFPGNVADQLARDKLEQDRKATETKKMARRRKQAMNSNFFGDQDHSNDPYADDEEDDDDILIESKPIADLFPSATVLFADIAGFTAWSSIREPSQVFILLENIYRAFDKIAVQRRIFKVETIGDCYVAVCGLPEPNKEHAVAMAKFSRDCMEKMDSLVHRLEAKLGPDTGDLSMRFGLHSGPVTAGVLRGDRARFQLFGDTVNTAARMESTGMRDRIHISQETADLIIAAGKSHWVVPREDVVVAKGKGEMRTFWLLPREDVAPSTKASSETMEEFGHVEVSMDPEPMVQAVTAVKSDKIQRMIDWNCDILLQLLRLIGAKRQASRRASISGSAMDTELDELEREISTGGLPVDEIVECIELPSFDSAAYEKDPRFVEIGEAVEAQLHSFVTIVASMYRDTPFHNFEHASHVSMSTVKLLSRIVAPTQPMQESEDGVAGEELHDHTYGITSDPLTQFAVVLSALIHDADHRGVPNFILAKEEERLAQVYRNKSIAEQNSIDVAWEVLMEAQYHDLRRAIYTTAEELRRFRQLVVNTVMATDIFDKDLAMLRKSRWEKAFGVEDDYSPEATNRKATVVMEHLIQASDVSHTMQHWHVYTKWNERLYREMYAAYLAGRTDKDPTDGWYEGEIKFFDGWVIPLAKKLKECGVFGVSSDEYLNYAEKNRAEWVVRGEDVLENFKAKAAAKSKVMKRIEYGDHVGVGNGMKRVAFAKDEPAPEQAQSMLSSIASIDALPEKGNGQARDLLQ
mmetsp:Transcript_20229/g.43726  ORF Transcript_20229/g.43726 Transcript_20229/m.43726 type:complete len:1181 (+) Transcript_20229:158-3700(+)